MSFYESSGKAIPVDNAEYEKLVVKYYKLRVISNVFAESLSRTAISSETLKINLLLDFMERNRADLEIPKQRKQVKASLSLKDCDNLKNHINQQVQLICEPVISFSTSFLKQHPGIFEESFTKEKLLVTLIEKRKSLIDSILEAKKRKCELLIQLIERKVAPENEADLEKMLMKFRLREMKARAMDMSVLKSIEKEDPHILVAYQEVEKHLNEILRSRDLVK